MISLPIRLSINYQIKQVNHKVGKKHRRKSTYNNPNVHIKTIEPCIYIIKHLLQQFIYGILGIATISEMLNHTMNNITNSKIVFRLNGLQMLGVLRGGTK